MKSFFTLSVLLCLFFINCGQEQCIGDCGFDTSPDTGLFFHQISDFEGTRVRLQRPSEAITIHEEYINIQYRNINKNITMDAELHHKLDDIPEKEIQIFIQIINGDMIIKGIRY